MIQSARHKLMNPIERSDIITMRVAARSFVVHARVAGVDGSIAAFVQLAPLGVGVYMIYRGHWALGAGIAILGPVVVYLVGVFLTGKT